MKLKKNHMQKKLIFLSFLAISILVSGFIINEKEPAGNIPTLEPEPHHSRVAKEIVSAIRLYHYEKQELDDSLSSLIFDKYIKMIDGNKLYLLKSDVDKFAKYRYQLDDQLAEGNLSFAYDLYNIFTERAADRVQYTLSLKEAEFNFNANESYKFDRTKDEYLKTMEQMDSVWYLKIKYEVLSLKLAGKKDEQSNETIQKRYSNFLDQLKKQKSEDVFQLYMNALAESVEPHTTYFSPRNADNFKITMSNSLEGIGATLRTDGEFTKVVSVTKGSPADKSKEIKANDKIVAVGQGETGEMEDVIGLRIDDVVSKIRGPKGSVVRLEIIPADAAPGAPNKLVKLVRDKIKLEEQSAKSEIMKVKEGNKTYKIGVIDLPSFYLDYEAMQRGEKDFKSTVTDVNRILKEFEKEKVDGVVMDLRGNGGGSLHEAVELTGLFIDKGPVVQVKDQRGFVEVKNDEPGVAYAGPLAVLTDRFSASASEIFAGAVQDYGRGIIIGSQTYGKGTVQNMMDLARLLPRETAKLGQLKMTLAKFYRISGGSTQHAGVTPDILFPSMIPSEEFGESSEITALPYDKIAPTGYKPVNDLQGVIPSLNSKHKERMKNSKDMEYLMQDIQEYAKRKNEKAVTLNESKLKAERDSADKRELEKYNLHRIAKGLKPIDKLEDKPKDEKPDDFLLDEANRVLIDYINLIKGSAAPQVMKNN